MSDTVKQILIAVVSALLIAWLTARFFKDTTTGQQLSKDVQEKLNLQADKNIKR